MMRIVFVLAAALASVCSQTASPVAPVRADMAATSGLTGPSNGSGPITVASTAATGSAAAYEQRFMTGMIDHHQMAVEMARICLSKAVHDELRQMCESIIAAQSREIRQMQDWLSDWYGVSYTPEMSNKGSRQLARLSSLSGSEFEIAFMESMIEHHEAAIREAGTCLDRAAHRQLLRLCESVIAAQSAEIEQLQEWLCTWYGRCA